MVGSCASNGAHDGPSDRLPLMAAEPIPRAAEIVVGDDPARWAALGFAVGAGAVTVGGVRIILADGPPGLRELRLHGLRTERPDGLPLTAAGDVPGSAAVVHPNGAQAVDHVVALTDDAARTSAALEIAGLPLRRIRRPPESAPV